MKNACMLLRARLSIQLFYMIIILYRPDNACDLVTALTPYRLY